MEQKVKLELTVDELNKVLAGLGELKASLVMNLILRLEKEANEQLSPKEEVENG